MKKGISKKLMKNYIYMYIVTFTLPILVFVIVPMVCNIFSSYKDSDYAQKLMKDDYREINAKEIKEHNGTAFVVDKDLKVIPICGSNVPKYNNFTMSQWTNFIGAVNLINENYSCNIEYNDKSKFWLVTEMPVSIKVIFNFNINTTKEVLPEAITIVVVGVIMYFLLFFIYVFIYSKLTSKYFVKPLEMFCHMVKSLEKGKYAERLKINKDDEFGILADSFNNLADSLENEKKLRKEAEDNRKMLILGISHDLKNPLTSTMGSLELCLQQKDLNPKQRHYIKMAYDNSIRAKVLINDLFEYSKMDTPEYKLSLEKVDFCEYMRIQIASELDIIEEAGFKSEYKIPEKSIYAEIDVRQFERVIHNLISNTIKYNEADTKIQIEVKEIGKNVEIIIKDDGIGIDKKLAKEIFDRFVRGDKESQASGAGLGLTIAKKIVTLHNGIITLETDINMGCTFIIVLPKV